MNMFTNYQDLSNMYIPNNLSKAYPTYSAPTKLNPVNASKPYEEYNTKGELEGYFWRYGESINLEFDLDGEITVESNSIVFYTNGRTPITENSVADVGTKAYNVADLISWECIARHQDACEWRRDVEFTYPAGADKTIYISAVDYLKDKKVKINLYNFRMESVHEVFLPGNPQIILCIDPELSKKFNKGIYYCSVEVIGRNTHQTVFAPQDCKLLVK